MRLTHGRVVRLVVSAALAVAGTWAAGPAAVRGEGSLDKAATDQIEAAVGAKGAMNDDEQVYKVTFPRTDVTVMVDGVNLPPFAGLTSWAAFKSGANGAMVMGDVVLFQDEIAPAMDAAFAGGLDVTALHNHFLYDEPRAFFMHVGGEGEPGQLAAGVKKVLDAVKRVRAASPEVARVSGDRKAGEARPAGRSSITAGPLADAIGAEPAVKDGMAKFTIGREVTLPCRCPAGKEMGVNTWAAFYGSDDRAIVDGDFATVEGELQPVLRALRKAGIYVVAIHNHMEGETPKVVFLHYWGVGPAKDLAAGVRSALDAQKAAAAKRAEAEKADKAAGGGR